MSRNIIDAFQYVDDSYLDLVDRMSSKENVFDMKKQKTKSFTRILVIAAVIAMLAVTAYAADVLQIRSLLSRTDKSFGAYSELEDAMNRAGFRFDAKENFENGFAFSLVKVKDVDAMDEHDRKVMDYKTISVFYENNEGKRLILSAAPCLEELPQTRHDDGQFRQIGDLAVAYYVDHYKFVPEDYQLTAEDEVWKEQPGNFLSYGDDEVREVNMAFLCWEKDGISYSLLDMGAMVPPDTVFAMAEELILG